ncbi:LPXTG cell wall anchor domain-containing protein [uncultured Enterococcus sp.]|uniref:LPXTG cell wall anchor domain-containing protein n=1 Tax=uncultured Enterococcus sp. TaxID=167972 RepID=UPI002AA8CC72|nr:LPXTG cell wall anchor domain-containing protein [uncultured Enterococcus sp.]
MKKRVPVLLITSFFLVWSLVASFPIRAAANGNGGSVQTNGVISFYDETIASSSTDPTDSSTTDSSTSQSSTTDSSTVEKPAGGKLPSTGELVKMSLSISGVAVIAAVLLFFFWKKRKDNSKREGNE